LPALRDSHQSSALKDIKSYSPSKISLTRLEAASRAYRAASSGVGHSFALTAPAFLGPIESDVPAARENAYFFQGAERTSIKSDWRISSYPYLIGKLPFTEMLVISLFGIAYLRE